MVLPGFCRCHELYASYCNISLAENKQECPVAEVCSYRVWEGEETSKSQFILIKYRYIPSMI